MKLVTNIILAVAITLGVSMSVTAQEDVTNEYCQVVAETFGLIVQMRHNGISEKETKELVQDHLKNPLFTNEVVRLVYEIPMEYLPSSNAATFRAYKGCLKQMSERNVYEG